MTYNKKFDDDLDREIIECLEGDQILNLKLKKGGSSGGVYREGICPNCGRKSIWVSAEKPWHLKCDHEGSCGYTTTIKERYPELFENFSKKHPPTDDDPKATARAYMKRARGFHSPTVHSSYEQGVHRLKNGQAAATVRFQICEGITWERIIDKADIKADDGGKARIKKQDNTKTYTNQCWVPPTLEINEGDTVYIVEGIFCAIAMYLEGYKAVAAISCGNLPRELIKEHQNRNIKWRLAYDDEPAAHRKIPHYTEELEELNQAFEVLLTGCGDDWNDAYLAGKLNNKYLEECQWRGRLFTAGSPTKKAYALACWKKGFRHDVIEFHDRLYSVKFNADKYAEANEGCSDLLWGFSEKPFEIATAVKRISNCVPKFAYVETNQLTGERQYYFTIRKAGDNNSYGGAMTHSCLSDPRSFSNSLMANSNGCDFSGTTSDLNCLKSRWLDGTLPTVRTISFIGYDEETQAYIFPDCAYHQGKAIKMNKQGYFEINGKGVKSNIKGIEFEHSDTFNGSFINDYHLAFHHSGICTLSFFTTTLFIQQIKKIVSASYIYELTGERGAGKSTQLRFCWRLFGRNDDWEGIDMLCGSESGLFRELDSWSNIPVIVIESDRDPKSSSNGRPRQSFNWDVFKKITDKKGVLDTKGVKTNDNSTLKRFFKSGLGAGQNESIEAGEATMSRIMHTHADRSHHTETTKVVADRLKTMPIEQLSGYLPLVLSKESEYLERFFESYPKFYDRLKGVLDFDDRIISFHAQMMAGIDCLSMFFPQWSEIGKSQALDYVVERAKNRQKRLQGDHPLVSKFWDMYDYLNDNPRESYIKGVQLKDDERLNHSTSHTTEIAIDLNEFIREANEHNLERLNIDDLIQLLPTSSHNRFIVARKQVRSRLPGNRRPRCWIFTKNPKERG